MVRQRRLLKDKRRFKTKIPKNRIKESREYAKSILIPIAAGNGKITLRKILKKGQRIPEPKEFKNRRNIMILKKKKNKVPEKKFNGGTNFRRNTPEKIEKIRKHNEEMKRSKR